MLLIFLSFLLSLVVLVALVALLTFMALMRLVPCVTSMSLVVRVLRHSVLSMRIRVLCLHVVAPSRGRIGHLFYLFRLMIIL